MNVYDLFKHQLDKKPSVLLHFMINDQNQLEIFKIREDEFNLYIPDENYKKENNLIISNPDNNMNIPYIKLVD